VKRRYFIPAAASILASTPGLTNAAAPRREIQVNAGADREGEPFALLDATFEVKVSGKDTEGRCVIFDTVRHKKIGPALHLHTDCDEWFFLRDGEFKFRVGEKLLRLKAGDSLLVPREMPHAFVKTSEGDARLIVMHQPAVGMEEFFRLASKQSDQYEAMKLLAGQYGIRFLGPSLTPD
jgi:quercetin 2,3-dioxygenase